MILVLHSCHGLQYHVCTLIKIINGLRNYDKSYLNGIYVQYKTVHKTFSKIVSLLAIRTIIKRITYGDLSYLVTMQAVDCNLHHKLSFVYTCRVCVHGKAVILPNQIANYIWL